MLPSLLLASLAPAQEPDDFARLNPRLTPEVLVVREAAPAVVYIEAERPFAAGFNRLTGQLRVTPETVRGSGVVVEKSGYVVTNFHVVGNDARRITVEFDPELDATVYEAEFISGAPSEDLALLRIRAEREFPVVRRGTSSDLMIGERVVAIGNPHRQRLSVSSGIISGLHRNVKLPGGLSFDDLIQTDAAINPGNSGGPLLNILGEMVGINTAVAQGAENMGFAIPVDRVEEVLRDHLLVPAAARSWLGLEVDQEHGFLVCEVVPGGPAAEAEIEHGERLVAIDGHPLAGSEDYVVRRLGLLPNRTVRLTLAGEDGARREVALVGWDKVDGVLFQRMGLTLQTFALGNHRRPRVERVQAAGPASVLGLARGDVIDSLRVGGGRGTWIVPTPEAVAALISGLPRGTQLEIDILRDADGDGALERDEIFRGSLVLE